MTLALLLAIVGFGSWQPAWAAFTAMTSTDARFGAQPVFPDRLYAWGRNDEGQLGLGDTSDRDAPALVRDSSFLSVSSSTRSMCGIRYGPTLWCWGNNDAGELGIGTTTGQTRPAQVPGTWTTVWAGSENACALKPAGTLWCWGANGQAQLGIGGTTDQSSPVQVGAATWRSAGLGVSATCGVQAAGTLWCWGTNNRGQLGNGTVGGSATAPVQVGSDTDWSSVVAGETGMCALRTGGTVWCWGGNEGGQLGLGSYTDTYTPTQVGSSANWKTLTSGFDSVCGLQSPSSGPLPASGGTLWCWGYNSNGALGTGNTYTSNNPLQVGTASDWTTVGSGYDHRCALRVPATLWCWGLADYGALGNGSASTDTSVPVQVGTFAAWKSINAGAYSDSTTAVQ